MAVPIYCSPIHAPDRYGGLCPSPQAGRRIVVTRQFEVLRSLHEIVNNKVICRQYCENSDHAIFRLLDLEAETLSGVASQNP
jgi:hypothetical protein